MPQIPFEPQYPVSQQSPASVGMRSPASGLSSIEASQAGRAQVAGAAGDLISAVAQTAVQVSASREAARDHADYQAAIGELSRLTGAAELEASRLQFSEEGADSYREQLRDVFSRRDQEFSAYLAGNSEGGIPHIRGAQARAALQAQRVKVSMDTQARIESMVAQREEHETRQRWASAVDETINSGGGELWEASVAALEEVAAARAAFGDSPEQVRRELAAWKEAMAVQAANQRMAAARYVVDLMTMPGDETDPAAMEAAGEHYNPDDAGETVRLMIEGAIQEIVEGRGVFALLDDQTRKDLVRDAQKVRAEAGALIQDAQARAAREYQMAYNTEYSRVAALAEQGASLRTLYEYIDGMGEGEGAVQFSPEDRHKLRDAAARYVATVNRLAGNPSVPPDYRLIGEQVNAINNLRTAADKGEIWDLDSWRAWEESLFVAATQTELSEAQFRDLHQYGRDAFNALALGVPTTATQNAKRLLTAEIQGFLRAEQMVMQTGGRVVESRPHLREMKDELPRRRPNVVGGINTTTLTANDFAILDRALEGFIARNPAATELEMQEFISDLLLPRRKALMELALDARIRAMLQEGNPLLDDDDGDEPVTPEPTSAGPRGGAQRPGTRAYSDASNISRTAGR